MASSTLKSSEPEIVEPSVASSLTMTIGEVSIWQSRDAGSRFGDFCDLFLNSGGVSDCGLINWDRPVMMSAVADNLGLCRSRISGE